MYKMLHHHTHARCGISIPSSGQAKVVFSRWRRSFSLESRRCPRVPPLRSWIGGGEGPPIPSLRGAPSRAPGPAMPLQPHQVCTGQTCPTARPLRAGPLATKPSISRAQHACSAHLPSSLTAQLDVRRLDKSRSLTNTSYVLQVCFRPEFPTPTSRPRIEDFSSTTSSFLGSQGTAAA